MKLVFAAPDAAANSADRLPVKSESDPFYTLMPSLAYLKGDVAERFVAKGLSLLPVIAGRPDIGDNTPADDLVKIIADLAQVPTQTFSKLAFQTLSGKHVCTSAPIGRSKRTAAAVWTPGAKPPTDKEISIVTGCFRGTLEELLQESDKNHGKGSKYNQQYRKWANAIRQVARRKTLPSTEQAVGQAISEMQIKMEDRARRNTRIVQAPLMTMAA